MSELKIPVILAEIFRGPGFADDNFMSGWGLTSGGTSSFSTDGDIVTLNSGTEPACVIEKTFPATIHTNAHGYIEAKITSCVGSNWEIALYQAGAWDTYLSGSESGVFEHTLIPTNHYTKIRLRVAGNVLFDYVFISKLSMLQPAVDLSQSAEIVLPLLELGIASAKLSLPNYGDGGSGPYTGSISEFDRIIIWLYRQGDTEKKVFGGKITDYTYRGQQQDFWLDLDCLGLGQQLHAPSGTLQKVYQSVNGKTIILDAVAACSELTNKFVDVDNEIASTHSVTHDEVLPFQIITEICKKATTAGGAVGFDGYVDPAGNVHIFKTQKYASPVTLSNIRYEHPINAHRIRNKQTVYGAKSKTYPVPTDLWCESLDGWSAGINETLSLEAADVKIGTYSIKDATTGGSILMVSRSLISQPMARFRNEVLKFKGWFKLCPNYGTPTSLQIRFKTGSSGYYEYVYRNPPVNAWFQLDVDLLSCGVGNGSPSWDTIDNMDIVFINDTSHTGYWLFDDVHFSDQHYQGTSSDATSISKYGILWAEAQEDETLTSDAECQLKAESLINFLKGTIDDLPVTVDGDNGFTQGYMQQSIIPNDAVNAYFRMMEIRHILEGVTWDTALKLSNQPKIMDYIFASTLLTRKTLGALVVK